MPHFPEQGWTRADPPLYLLFARHLCLINSPKPRFRRRKSKSARKLREVKKIRAELKPRTGDKAVTGADKKDGVGIGVGGGGGNDGGGEMASFSPRLKATPLSARSTTSQPFGEEMTTKIRSAIDTREKERKRSKGTSKNTRRRSMIGSVTSVESRELRAVENFLSGRQKFAKMVERWVGGGGGGERARERESERASERESERERERARESEREQERERARERESERERERGRARESERERERGRARESVRESRETGKPISSREKVASPSKMHRYRLTDHT